MIDYSQLTEFGIDLDAEQAPIPGVNNAHVEDPIALFMGDVYDELDRANGLHPGFNSHHEAYAVILEELEEYWSEVKKKSSERDAANMYTELVHTAAMCLRAVVSLKLHEARP